MKYDFKYYGLKGFYEWNKNKFFIDKKDKRYKNIQKFKKENGFYPDECWDLYQSICIFIIPRLKYFRNTTCGIPGCFCDLNNNNKDNNEKNHKKWLKILDKMIWSFEEILKDNNLEIPKKYYKKANNDENKAYELYNKDINEGLQLFATYFMNLWW